MEKTGTRNLSVRGATRRCCVGKDSILPPNAGVNRATPVSWMYFSTMGGSVCAFVLFLKKSQELNIRY